MEQLKKYQQIYAYLREKIAAGEYDDKGRLESETALCARFDASRLTVRQATQMLEQEGLVYRRKGSGTFVRSILPPIAVHGRRQYNRIGVIVPTINDLPYSAFFELIEQSLINIGCTVLLRSTNRKMQVERDILIEFSEIGVDGIIVNGTLSALPSANAWLYEQLYREGTPVVFLGEPYRELNFPSVTEDDTAAAEALVSHLASLGHKKIACLFALDSVQGHNRFAGYCRAHTNERLEFSDSYVYWYSGGDEQTVINRFQAGNCTACICQNDRIAELLIHRLEESGIRVPQDFSVVGMDGQLPLPAEENPAITTAVHPTEEISYEATRMVVEAINGVTPTSRTLPMQLYIGETTAPPKNPNPIIGGDWADPFVLPTEDGYYLFPTHRWDDSKFYAFHSENLLHWSGPQKILDLESVPWANRGAWTPCVMHYHDLYYMAYIADRRLGFAYSKTPMGEYTNLTKTPFLVKQADNVAHNNPYDPHLFVEDDKVYLLYGLNPCWLVELNVDRERITMAGEPIRLSDRLITEDGEPFIAEDKNKFNGCTRIVKLDGRYLLTWSRYDTRDPRCQICYAWADSITGPYVMPKSHVLLRGSDGTQATGHGCIVEANGELQLFYHRINYSQESYRQEICREVCCDPIVVNEDGTLSVFPT